MELPPEITADFQAYQEQVASSLINVTRSAGRLSSEDLAFHRSSNEKFSKSLASQNAHLLRLTNKLLKAATKETNVKAPHIPNSDGIDDNWRQIVDVIDNLLEKADASLDEYNGLIKTLSPAQQDSPLPATPPPAANSHLGYNSYSSIPKPQLSFARKVDNYANEPWKPLLRTKPHSVIPLKESIGPGKDGYNHPYKYEIENTQAPEFVYQEKLPIPFTRPENTEPVYVDTEEGVEEMLKELKQAKEIAIDLEHNDRNSYVGLVCLMQISTRNKDWIVDTLRPWRENLQVLNEVFADPKIIKVLHGSTMDIIWLQRDLGLYIVGLFDTYHACVELNFPGRGLAFLLQKYANFYAQKQYQLADWRVRPLPTELLDYARSDTHYLLYIYDNLRNELLRHSTPEFNLLERVLENSNKEALQVYERSSYDNENGLGPNGWMKLLLPKLYKNLSKEQFGVLRALHEWRDRKARQLDDGEATIMTNQYLWTCAEAMPVARKDLFQGRLGKTPRFVAQHYEEFIQVIKDGKDAGREGLSVQEVLDRNEAKLSVFRTSKKFKEQKPQDVNRSVAATLQLLRPSVNTVNGSQASGVSTETESLVDRSTSSQLWGAMKPNLDAFVSNLAALKQALQIVLPMNKTPSVEASHLGIASEYSQEMPTPAATMTESNGVPNNTGVQETDDIFTLRSRDKKRKADEMSMESGEISGDDQEVDGNAEEIEATPDRTTSRKQRKKAAKKAKQEAKKAAQAVAQTGTVPFDYANAPSVLHPSPQSARVDPKQGFNPFAKALDTSTGAKRNKMAKELAGRSHTFKS